MKEKHKGVEACRGFIGRAVKRQKFQRYDIVRHRDYGLCVIVASYEDKYGKTRDHSIANYEVWRIPNHPMEDPDLNTIAWERETEMELVEAYSK